jgi:hypothetical protein
MDTLLHFIWMVFTFPIWFISSLFWIIVKFIFYVFVSIFMLFTKGFNSFEDLLLYPLRLINLTFQNSNIVYDKFSEIYYESTVLKLVIIIFMIVFYSYAGGNKK